VIFRRYNPPLDTDLKLFCVLEPNDTGGIIGLQYAGCDQQPISTRLFVR
jgi:hypothetical protein